VERSESKASSELRTRTVSVAERLDWVAASSMEKTEFVWLSVRRAEDSLTRTGGGGVDCGGAAWSGMAAKMARSEGTTRRKKERIAHPLSVMRDLERCMVGCGSKGKGCHG